VDQPLTQYYTYLHVSYLCVLLRWALESRKATEEGVSAFVLPILFYIGSVFTHSIDMPPLANAAAKALEAGRLKTTAFAPCPYFKQALTLSSIAVY
jgi:hypothetical protein